MLYWFLGIVAVWLIVGTVVAYWIGRTISHTKLEEASAELRRAEKYETQPVKKTLPCAPYGFDSIPHVDPSTK